MGLDQGLKRTRPFMSPCANTLRRPVYGAREGSAPQHVIKSVVRGNIQVRVTCE